MTQQRKILRDPKVYLLTGLLLSLLIVNMQRFKKSTDTRVRSNDSRRAQQTFNTGDPILMAENLSAEKEEFQQEKRNIFAFFEPAPSPAARAQAAQAAPPPPAPVCGNGVCETGEDLMNCPGDCQPPPPPAPVISLRYIGYMHEAEGSVAFLTDGREVYMGRVNDVIANQYRVLKITEDSVELGFLNNDQSSTIRFQGNQGG